jgi:arginyl-tRNA synthetase
MIQKIIDAIKKVLPVKAEIAVAASEKEDFGHYSTNAAFKLAPLLKKKPMEIANELAEKLKEISDLFSRVEAVAPGFVNFWLTSEILQKEVARILKSKTLYPKPSTLNPKKINVEFVSANPTGPLTMANGRGGFYGDALANVLENAGHKVTREYFINDTGNQIRLLGDSILAVLGKIRKKEEHYKGRYIQELAKKFRKDIKDQDALSLGQKAAKVLLNEIKKSLGKAGIKFDEWFSENKNLHQRHELKKTLAFLERKGLIEQKDGAVWLGDAVLIKSDNSPTYFLADLAYHYDKFLKRKFDLVIDIWGADHHGYAEKMKKGVRDLGIDLNRLKIIIIQLVRLVSGNKEVKMSKRTGEFITMDELLKKVGVDVARFFFLMHSPDTHMDFDLDLAKERSQKNPVYYVQYAYVRCVNILRKSQFLIINYQLPNLNLLNSESEIKLMLEMAKFPDVLAETAKDYQVHRLTKYAIELARAWHNFYEKERVVGAGGDLEKARLALAAGAKIVFENLFGILGIGKPKKM